VLCGIDEEMYTLESDRETARFSQQTRTHWEPHVSATYNEEQERRKKTLIWNNNSKKQQERARKNRKNPRSQENVCNISSLFCRFGGLGCDIANGPQDCISANPFAQIHS